MAAEKRLNGFKEVHKGLRNALFELAVQAGSADADQPGEMENLARKAREVFHFLDHHSGNEDRYLVPDMEAKSMPEAARVRGVHGALEAEAKRLVESSTRLDSTESLYGFYLALNRFIAQYLGHLDEEETEILPALHARFTDAELANFPRQSVANTSPEDKKMMLAHMFPAMNASELRTFFGAMRNAPPEVLRALEGLAERVLGARAACLR